jgi:hypothetical protein
MLAGRGAGCALTSDRIKHLTDCTVLRNPHPHTPECRPHPSARTPTCSALMRSLMPGTRRDSGGWAWGPVSRLALAHYWGLTVRFSRDAQASLLTQAGDKAIRAPFPCHPRRRRASVGGSEAKAGARCSAVRAHHTLMKALMSRGVQLIMRRRSSRACSRFMLPSMAWERDGVGWGWGLCQAGNAQKPALFSRCGPWPFRLNLGTRGQQRTPRPPTNQAANGWSQPYAMLRHVLRQPPCMLCRLCEHPAAPKAAVKPLTRLVCHRRHRVTYAHELCEEVQ